MTSYFGTLQHLNIPKEFLGTVLDSTFFTFEGKYTSNFDISMSSPLLPIIVDLVMQNLERGVLKTLNLHIPLLLQIR